jgi:hypothetical protein
MHALSAVAASASAIAGLNLTGFLGFLPTNVAAVVAVAPPIIAALGHAALAIGDHLDDGVDNDSFHCSPVAWILAFAVAVFGLCACVETTAPDGTVTKTPDGAVIRSSFDYANSLLDRYAPPVAQPVTPAK